MPGEPTLIDEIQAIKRRLAELESNVCGPPTVAATANRVCVLDASAKGPFDITGNAATATSVTNADTVDNIHAATTPTANKLLACGADALFPAAAGFTGQWQHTSNIIRGVFSKALVDNVATAVFTITTTNEPGSTDGGVYICKVTSLITDNGLLADDDAIACKGAIHMFTRSLINTGATGICGTVSEIVETAGSSTSANRVIGACTGIAAETSEYVVNFQLQVDHTGGGSSILYAICDVELIWCGFLHAPVLANA